MGSIDQFLDWAHQGLLQSEEGQDYLQGRGVSPKQWARHRIGYVLGEYAMDLSMDPGHSDACFDREKKSLRCDSCRFNRWSSEWEELEDGKVKGHVGRRIVGSVVLPLTSYSGHPIGFQVRSTVKKSYDTFILKRHPEGFFFGVGPNMESIWRTSEIWLVEGPIDALILERLVAPNVAALATSSVSPLQARFLRRFVTRVNLLLDVDKAGRDGVKSFIQQHGAHFDVRDIRCPVIRPKDKDLGDLWKAVGDDGVRRHMSKLIGELRA